MAASSTRPRCDALPTAAFSTANWAAPGAEALEVAAILGNQLAIFKQVIRIGVALRACGPIAACAATPERGVEQIAETHEAMLDQSEASRSAGLARLPTTSFDASSRSAASARRPGFAIVSPAGNSDADDVVIDLASVPRCDAPRRRRPPQFLWIVAWLRQLTTRASARASSRPAPLKPAPEIALLAPADPPSLRAYIVKSLCIPKAHTPPKKGAADEANWRGKDKFPVDNT